MEYHFAWLMEAMATFNVPVRTGLEDNFVTNVLMASGNSPTVLFVDAT
jgi:hypothetical protein